MVAPAGMPRLLKRRPVYDWLALPSVPTHTVELFTWNDAPFSLTSSELPLTCGVMVTGAVGVLLTVMTA